MTDVLQAAGRGDAEGWRSLLRGNNGPRALIVTGGVAIHAVSIYVVATIMPLVVGDIGGLAFFAWTTTLYIAGSLCSASAVPLLLSRSSPRRVYRLAFGLFLSGSLVCSLAPNMGVLLVGRLVQGLGGGMLPALAYAIIRQIFPPVLHARGIALVGSVWGIAAVVGPSLGGVFAQYGVWRGAFWVDVVIGLSFIAVSERALPLKVASAIVARPVPGLRLALLVLAALCVGSGGAVGRPLPALLGLGGAVVLIAAMLRVDAASTPRMLPGGAFNPRVALGALSATLGLMILSASPCTFITYLLHAGHGVAPVIGGYVNAVYALAWTVASLLSASATAGARRAIGLGPLLMLTGLTVVGWAVPAGVIAMVVVGQVLMGAGIGMAWPHLGAMLMSAAPPAEREVTGPFIATTQTLAAVFGSALAGMVANLAGLATAATPAEINGVGAWLFATLTVVPLAACLLAWRALALTRRARIDPICP